jgi:teichuronic acid biosynthesis glycosyltransferase TuaC
VERDVAPENVSPPAPLRVIVASNHWQLVAAPPYGGVFVDRQVAALAAQGVAVETFDVGLSHAPLALARKVFELRRAARTGAADVVQARYGTVVAAVAVAAGRPAVITFCGSDLLPGASVSFLRTWMGIALSNVAAVFARRVVCVSEELRRSLWFAKRKAVVIPDGVDLELFSPGSREESREELGWDPAARIVLFSGARDPRNKGLDLALAAMERVRTRLPDAALVTVSAVPPERMPSYYRAADVLLCASRQEGSPNVVKEALACNLPVVSTPVGDVPERLVGVRPSAVVPRQVQAIADALVDVLRSGQRCNGRETVLGLSQHLVAARVAAVLREAARK